MSQIIRHRPKLLRETSYCVNRFLRFSTTSCLRQSPSANSGVESADPAEEGELLNARSIPRDWISQKRLLQIGAVQQPSNPKQLVVSLLGAPNSGKSTLANRIVGRKICGVSPRVDTTLHKTLAVSTEGDTQLVIFDTPGIVDPYRKKHYADPLLRDPHIVLARSDVVVVVVDVANKLARKAIHPEIMKVLHMRQDKETLLVLNKVDLVPHKGKLLNIVRLLTGGIVAGTKGHTTTYEEEERKGERAKRLNLDPKEFVTQLIKENENRVTADGHLSSSLTADEDREYRSNSEESLQDYIQRQEIPCPETNWTEYKHYLKWLHPRLSSRTSWSGFSKVFLISALEADGTEEVKTHIMSMANPGAWTFHENVLTDQNPREIVLLTVREKLLEFVAEDVPYNLKLSLIDWQVHDLFMEIHVGVGIRHRSKAKMTRDRTFLLGRKGDAIKRVSTEARIALADTFRCEVSLKIHVVTPKAYR